MTSEPTVEQAFPTAPRYHIERALGWVLVVVGTLWTAAALWAVLFVLGVDRSGTEFVTAILNPLIPALLLPPGGAILRAGLRRVGPLPVQRWARSFQASRFNGENQGRP